MKRLLALVGLVLAVALSPARAQSPDEDYIRIYNLMQQADALKSAGQSTAALDKYREAQTDLQNLQKGNPDWNPKVVSFRLAYIASKIAAITSNASTPAAPTKPAAPVTQVAPSKTATGPPAASADLESQLAALKENVRKLQADKTLLEKKLKEALATRPAAVDPRELAKAQEQIQSLLKENELLKVSLGAGPARLSAGGASKELSETKAALAEAHRKLDEQNVQATKLAAEKKTLVARINTLAAGAEAAEALRAENQVLKRQLAQARLSTGKSGDLGHQLAQAEARVASLQSDAEILRLEKMALENRIRTSKAQTVASSTNPPVARPEDLQRIKLLENERYDLAKKLDAANKELYGRKGRAISAKVEELNGQITTLRARLQVYEARAVPYTTEELALFKESQPVLAATNPNTGRKSVKVLPAGAAELVAEAQQEFAAKNYEKAEGKYLEVVRQDENNAYTLANLAAIQLQLNRLDEADKHIQKALAIDPNDAYSLSILGFLRYRQGKYDEALDALSKAAKLNPQSAEIQNYLGVTLSHKGLRGPAETALRKAIELDPGYGDAHNNLAVIYATQQPPLIELARWHYQRALAAGHPRNPDLEKLLQQKSAARSP